MTMSAHSHQERSDSDNEVQLMNRTPHSNRDTIHEVNETQVNDTPKILIKIELIMPKATGWSIWHNSHSKIEVIAIMKFRWWISQHTRSKREVMAVSNIGLLCAWVNEGHILHFTISHRYWISTKNILKIHYNEILRQTVIADIRRTVTLLTMIKLSNTNGTETIFHSTIKSRLYNKKAE